MRDEIEDDIVLPIEKQQSNKAWGIGWWHILMLLECKKEENAD